MKEKIENIEKEQQVSNNCFQVSFKIKIKSNSHELVYKISGEQVVTAVPVLCDAVVTTFLPYAIKHDLDICSRVPMSTALYYNIKKQIIPQLSLCNNRKESKTTLDVPLSDIIFSGGWVGTGVSLGVDSFTSIHEYMEEDVAEEYKLTHLVHLKTGAHHGSLGYFDKKNEQKLFENENNRVKEYCKQYGHRLITIETNLFEITNKEFGYNFDTTHIFGNLGCIILMQNYFSKYYYASSYNLDAFELSLNVDCAHYEKWLIPNLSNKSLSMYSANEDMGRLEKTKYISKFDDTYKFLHVCWKNEKNCSKCDKCVRTLVTLDILGVLDKYKDRFDTEHYLKNKSFYLCQVAFKRKRDPFYNEIYQYMKANNIKTPNAFEMIRYVFKRCLMKISDSGVKSFVKTVKNIIVYRKK